MADTPRWLTQGFPTKDHIYAALVLKVVLGPFQGVCEAGTISFNTKTVLAFATPILSRAYSHIFLTLYDM